MSDRRRLDRTPDNRSIAPTREVANTPRSAFTQEIAHTRESAYTPGQSVLAPPRLIGADRRSSRGSAALCPCVWALLALPLATGCISEKFHAKDVDRYRAVLDQAAPTSRPAAYEPDRPLSLARALQIANADNEAIASSGESYVQALADKQRAAGAFLPTLSLAPSYSATRNRGSSGTSGIIIPGTDTGGGTGTGGVVQVETNSGSTIERKSVNANASLQTSLADLSNLQSSARTVEQREQLLLDQRETILLNVVQAYYDVLRNERQTRVFENSVSYRNEQVRDQEARLRLGGVRPLDVAQSQAEFAGVRAQLTQSRTDAQNARSALARLMGVDRVTGELTDAFELPGDVGPLAAWQTDALTYRQDLRAADRGLEAARANVESAIRQYFPSVSINFNYYLYNDPKSSTRWTGGINANVPIFSALQIEADVRRAWSVYRQAGLAQQETRRVVMDDINQNYQNVANSRARIADYAIQVEAAQRAVDLANRAYQLGSETNLDRLLQQDNLLSAQLNLVNEQFAEKRSYLALLRSSGRLATVLPPLDAGEATVTAAPLPIAPTPPGATTPPVMQTPPAAQAPAITPATAPAPTPSPEATTLPAAP